MAKNKAIFYGMNAPFLGGAQNVLSRQEDEKLIKNDILQLLLTVPGERVMRPDFGVPLRNFVFEQAVDADIIDLENSIRRAIAAFEPRVTVEDVRVVRDDARHGLNITIVVRLIKDPQRVLTIDKFFSKAT